MSAWNWGCLQPRPPGDPWKVSTKLVKQQAVLHMLSKAQPFAAGVIHLGDLGPLEINIDHDPNDPPRNQPIRSTAAILNR